MVAILAFPLFTPFNQVMLILPCLLLLQNWKTLPWLSRLIFGVIWGWPYIFYFLLLLLHAQANASSELPLLPAFLVSFMPLILPLLLMTRREDTGPLHPLSQAASI
jgi:hypothetical protein